MRNPRALPGRPALSRLIAISALAAALAAAPPATAAVITVFGEDAAAGDPASMPNAQAAQASFLAQLATWGSDGLEARPVDGSTSTLAFSGMGVLGGLSQPTLVRGGPSGGAFATAGSKYLSTTGSLRIGFSKPVEAFGVFATDVGDHDNDPATVTAGGQLLDPAQRAARPAGGEVDEVLRIYTERAGGTLELLFSGGALPAVSGGALFIGLIDTANPFTNLWLVNGAAGLDSAWNDGFGFDQFTVGTAAPRSGTVPEPAGLAVLALTSAALLSRRRRG